MVVIDRAPAGLGHFQVDPPWSRTMVWPQAKQTIAKAKSEAGNWVTVAPAPMSGLGFAISEIPVWGWGAIGLAVGGALTYFLVRR